MTSKLHQLTLSQLSLYNPARMSDSEIISSFAVREDCYRRLWEDIAGEKATSRPQHHLIVGQRGMGKSTLLARLAAEIRTNPSFKDDWIALSFPEEQYGVDRLSKFWLNCLDSLADACEREGLNTEVERIDQQVRELTSHLGTSAKKDRDVAERVLDCFLGSAEAMKRRPILFVDNLQIVFDRLANSQQHALREVLTRPGAPLVVGASPSPPQANEDYGAAFYDQFKSHYLGALTVDAMRSLMLTLADRVDRPDVRERVLQAPERLQVLRELTGGNPRTTVTLLFLFAEDFSPSVFGDLENLLDRVTPLYKARFEELSEQQQVVVSAVANHWDPITTKEVGKLTGLATSSLSSQMERMVSLGVLERVELFGTVSTGFQIAERFFNVWFLMRNASRRQRREIEFLTRFIESFYEPDDRGRLARRLVTENNLSPDRHLFARALGTTLPVGEAHELKRHAELDALRQKERDARKRLEAVIDFNALEPFVVEFSGLRERLEQLVPPESEVAPEEFADAVLGDRQMFLSRRREQIAASDRLSLEQVSKIMESVSEGESADLATYGADAAAWLRARLRQGQILSLEASDDWENAIRCAPEDQAVQALFDTIPSRVVRNLSDDAVSSIIARLEPDSEAESWRWANWGYDLSNVLGRFVDAEKAYRKAISLDENFANPWANLGNLLQNRLARYDESEAAYRRAILLDENFAYPWNGLGDLLQDHLSRYEESEAAYRKAISLEEDYAEPWNGLGNLLCDHLRRFDEAAIAYRKSIEVDALDIEFPLDNLVFLYRDFLADSEEGELTFLRLRAFHESQATNEIWAPDSLPIHESLFSAYQENWGDARQALKRALDLLKGGFSPYSWDDWMRASAVYFHLGLGSRLIDYLRESGYNRRLRPWFEALVAIGQGNRAALMNVAPEVRNTAEHYFDQIRKRLECLPEKTKRWEWPGGKKK